MEKEVRTQDEIKKITKEAFKAAVKEKSVAGFGDHQSRQGCVGE